MNGNREFGLYEVNEMGIELKCYRYRTESMPRLRLA